MDSYYIKEGNVWLGPLSEHEFEHRKAGSDEFVYWKPGFCPNLVLHPHLCSHTKSWVKPPIATEDNPSEELHKPVILNAKPLDPEDEMPEAPVEEDKKSTKETEVKKVLEKTSKDPGMAFKLFVIIIGFILVFIAGFYVNSKLSVMFYQDIIIQESVKDIEYYTRDMINETKEIRNDIDTLNAVMGREFKAIRKEISEVRTDLYQSNQ